MDFLITAIAFILIFSILVLIHEFGHFITAKRNGIKVEEFGFGLPPRLWGKKKGETIYSINWIPFGGFVRMLGEDSTDKKSVNNKRSFAAQNAWVRIKVVCAGVFMNFILAWLLLAIAFTAGARPFLSPVDSGDSDFVLGPDQVMQAIVDGDIDVNLGIEIADVEEGSVAQEYGFEEGDRLLRINDELITVDGFAEIVENSDFANTYELVGLNGGLKTISISDEDIESLGIGFLEAGPFPWLTVIEAPVGDFAFQEGDILLSVNGKSAHSLEDFDRQLRYRNYDLSLYRDGEYVDVSLFDNSFKIVVSDVFAGMPADLAGLENGDVILSIDENEFNDLGEAVNYIFDSEGLEMTFSVERNGEVIELKVSSDEQSMVGVSLTVASSYELLNGAQLASQNYLTSSKLNDVQYPLHVAVYKSFGETLRMSKFTAIMFVDFLGGFFTSGEVPESVAGPVGIATLTHGFVQEGFIALLVFMAILSLSLAAINILPIPALDGGRLLFILLEVLTGKKLNEKAEAYIHMFGYVLILFLILLVTYSDILRLVG